MLRGDGISLTEFRGYPVKIPEDPDTYARKGSGKREFGRKGGRGTMLRSIATHRNWLLLMV